MTVLFPCGNDINLARESKTTYFDPSNKLELDYDSISKGLQEVHSFVYWKTLFMCGPVSLFLRADVGFVEEANRVKLLLMSC